MKEIELKFVDISKYVKLEKQIKQEKEKNIVIE
jgi:hypothetical protein